MDDTNELGPALQAALINGIEHVFESSLLPGLKALGIIASANNTSQVLKELDDSNFSDLPRARLCVYVATALEAMAVVYEFGEKGGNLEELKKCIKTMWDEVRQCLSYMQALLDVRRQNAHRGASGRRKIGDETRKKVEAAAQALKGAMSKSRAAIKIAESIDKEPAHIEKILAKMFPGETWKAD